LCAALVLQALSLSGQVQPEDLKDKFERQVANVHQEKVYVHTDRPMYVTGETIWMSAYCVDAMFHLPNSLSRVLNIELLDNSGHAVKQVIIKMTEGIGNGQIFISPDIQSGYYVLRAYTNWMKNFNADYVFQKQIGIVSPSASPSNEQLEVLDSTFLEFFPEGGDLVYGLKSKVAVQVADIFGSGVSLPGFVFDNEGNQVAKFSTSTQGYSSFHLLPEKGKTYIARITRDSLIQEYNLPKIEESGVVITVTTNKVGDFNLDIGSKNAIQSTFYVITHTRGKIIGMKSLNLDIEQRVELLNKDLIPGITHITVMDHQFKPVAERLIFKYPEEQNPIVLNIPKREYGKREKVLLTLNLKGLESGEDLAKFSISVYRSSEHVPASENITSSLLLSSDLNGKIEDLGVYFDFDNKYREDQIDLVLLTHGWRRFDWGNVIQDKDIEIQYPAELNGPILSGLLSRNAQKELPRLLLISFIGKTSVMNSLAIDPDGIFHFSVPFRVRNERVHFFSMDNNLVTDQITVYSPFDLKSKNGKLYPINFLPDSKVFLEELNTNIQISQVYREFNHINGTLPEIDEPKTNYFGTPDYLYVLDEYTRFETVKDLFIELIRRAVIKNNNNKREDGIYVANEGLLPERALTTIDGVIILDANYMLNFDPLKIKKIELITDYYFIGDTRFSGIVNFTTYNGDFDQQELPEYMIEKAYHGIQRTREFYSPNYNVDTADLKRIADYRNTLYWNDNVIVTGKEMADLEFFTSDDSGTYKIEINGITNSGRPFYVTDEIYVSDNSSQ